MTFVFAYYSMMKVTTVEILWHNKEPIFSADFHVSGRLATAGGDNDVKVS
jgi:chromatin assembly factor 1 subunit B